MKHWLAGIALAFLSWRACALLPDAVEVSAHDESDHVVLSAHFFAPVTTELAWNVLIDFDHMTHFLPYLKESNVLWRNGNSLRVQQKGVVPMAFLNIGYTSVRDVDLLPMREIRSVSVGGDSGMMRSVSWLRQSGDRAEIEYRADWWPNSQMVAGFGMGTARDLLQRQFSAMRQEMLRRRQLPK